MEENVALDSKKQKKFVKSIRGIKKLIKVSISKSFLLLKWGYKITCIMLHVFLQKNEGKANSQEKDEKVEPKKPFSMRLKNGKINKKKRRKERGLVYLSHIPHGFYEVSSAYTKIT